MSKVGILYPYKYVYISESGMPLGLQCYSNSQNNYVSCILRKSSLNANCAIRCVTRYKEEITHKVLKRIAVKNSS